MIDLLIESALLGFGVVSVLLLPFCAWKRFRYHREAKQLLINSARIGAFSGTAYFISFLMNSVLFIGHLAEGAGQSTWGTMLNYPWGDYMMLPSIVAISTGLLWFQRFRPSPWINAGAGLVVVFITQIEYIVILITTFHRDYVPDNWSMEDLGFLQPYGQKIAINLLIYGIILMIVVYSKRWFPRQDKPDTLLDDD